MVWKIGEKMKMKKWDTHTNIHRYRYTHMYNQNTFYACMNTPTIKFINMLSIEYNPKWVESVYFSVVIFRSSKNWMGVFMGSMMLKEPTLISIISICDKFRELKVIGQWEKFAQIMWENSPSI